MFKLNENPTLETLDSVPSDFKPLYAEDETGGGFRINPAFSGLAAAVAKLQGSLQSSRKQEQSNRESYDQIKAFQQIGETPEAISALISDLQAKFEGASGKKEDLERFKEEFKASHKAQLDAHVHALSARDEKLLAMQASLESHLIVSSATQAIANAEGFPEILMPHIRGTTQVVVNEAGKHEVRVLDEQGEPRFNGATMEPMTIPELVAEMKASPVFGRCFRPTGTSGSNAKPNGNTPPRPLRGNPEKLDTTAKILAGLEERGRRR